MFRFFDQARYDVLGRWRVPAVVAALFTIPGLLLLGIRGVNTSIEFTGGSLIEVSVADESITTASIRAALLGGGVEGAEIQTFGRATEFVIRARLNQEEATEQATQETANAVRAALAVGLGRDQFEVVRTEAVGPKVGSELRERVQLALILAFAAIFVVIWFRYEWRFGAAAVLATVHDILSTLAFVSFLNLEVSLVVVAALLTIIGYSLNDTIVTFDRVRENLHKYKRSNIYEILNLSINETLPRTILTSGTTLGATIALLLMGGEIIRGFAWVMTFGVVTGTFSSIFIASPLLLLIERRWPGADVRGAKVIQPRGSTVLS